MPRNFWEEPIDENTPDNRLYRIILATQHSSDRNVVVAAGKAKAELERREQGQRMDELLVQDPVQRGGLTRRRTR